MWRCPGGLPVVGFGVGPEALLEDLEHLFLGLVEREHQLFDARSGCRTGSVTPVGCRSRRRVGLSRYLVGRCRLGSGLWLRVRHAGALGFLPAALHPRGHHGRGELLGHFGWGRGTRCRQWLAEFEAGPTSRAQNEPIGLYQRHEPRLTARTLRLYLFATHPSPINNPNWNGWPRGQRRTTSARSTTCSHPDTSPHKSWLRGRPERRTRAARRVRPV